MGALSASDVMSIISRSLGSFNLVNCVTALQRLAKSSELDVDRSHGDLNEATLAKLLQRSSELIESEAGTCEPRHLSGALWASARLGRSSPELEGAVAKASSMRAADFKPQEISNAVGIPIRDLQRPLLFMPYAGASLELLFRCVSSRRPPFPLLCFPAPSASLSHGRGSSSLRELLTSALSARLMQQMWAFAKLDDKSQQGDAPRSSLVDALDALVAVAATSIRQAAREWTPQGLSNVCWASATLGLRNESLLDALLEVFQKRSKDLNAQELSNTVSPMASALPSLSCVFSLISHAYGNKLHHSYR